MSLLELAFEEKGAHAGALLGFAVGVAVIFGAGRWIAGLAVVALTMWTYVLAYLGYAWRRLEAEREGRDWSRGQQFIALGALLVLPLPLFPLLLPLGLGSAAYRTKRYNDVVDLPIE